MHEVLDLKVANYYGYEVTPQDIGIEIEVEGLIPATQRYKYWRIVSEHSLRDGVEFVFRSPMKIKDVSKALSEFEDIITSKGYKPKQSIRTSVHVHRNVLDFSIREVYNVIGCFWLVEQLLVRLQGSEREGNLFCLRAGDAEAFVYSVVEGLKSQSFLSGFQHNLFRYSALNIESLQKFGTVEFRFLKGTTDIKFIQMWVEALFRMTNVARKESLENLLHISVSESPKAFLLSLFDPEFVDYIYSELPTHEIQMLLSEGYCYTLRLDRALKLAEKDSYKPKIKSEEDMQVEGSKLEFKGTVHWTNHPYIVDEDVDVEF